MIVAVAESVHQKMCSKIPAKLKYRRGRARGIDGMDLEIPSTMVPT